MIFRHDARCSQNDGWCKYLNGEMRKVNHLSRPYLFLVSLILTIILTKFAKLKDVVLHPLHRQRKILFNVYDKHSCFIS